MLYPIELPGRRPVLQHDSNVSANRRPKRSGALNARAPVWSDVYAASSWKLFVGIAVSGFVCSNACNSCRRRRMSLPQQLSNLPHCSHPARWSFTSDRVCRANVSISRFPPADPAAKARPTVFKRQSDCCPARLIAAMNRVTSWCDGTSNRTTPGHLSEKIDLSIRSDRLSRAKLHSLRLYDWK